MKYYIGVTDYDWFRFLLQRENEDINFWQPGGHLRFKAINQGAPFLFKLKYPYNAIAGVGFFSSHTFLPLDVAWNIFGERNGITSFFQFKQKIIKYRRARNSFDKNPNNIKPYSPVFNLSSRPFPTTPFNLIGFARR